MVEHQPKHDEDSTLTVGNLAGIGRRTAPLRLLVVGEGIYATHSLHENAELVIGRSDQADVFIDDPTVSRRHAVLHVRDGTRLLLQDLGSANGVRIRGESLGTHQTIELHAGDSIDIGSATLIVQRTQGMIRPRRMWTHGAFEARLEDECARAERKGSPFSLVRLHVGGSPRAPDIRHALWEEVRAVDVVAAYGPGEYEVLIVDATVNQVQEVLDRIRTRVLADGIEVKIGVAHYPTDGRAPEEIVARACAALRGKTSAGESPVVVGGAAMVQLHGLVKRIAVGTITVLLLGETGVGKEVFAESIHRESPRRKGAFLRLNCAALSESLLESELFGHEKGAFTGAVAATPGLLESADGGTVFLDEVGELPLSTQVKLLRVLEERKVMRVGARKTRPIDVRFVAATNRDLEAEISAGTFRQDLYFRLNGISLIIPPLRERLDELESLSVAFVKEASDELGRAQPPSLSLEAMALLRRYAWPGNIRELRNVMERAVLLCDGNEIQLEHLPVEKMGTILPIRASAPASFGHPQPGRGSSVPPLRPPAPFGSTQANAPLAPPAPEVSERDRIIDALEQCAGNQTKAAKLLGFSRRTLVARLEQYDLPRPRKGR